MEPPESSSIWEDHEPTEEEKNGVLYGIVLFTSNAKDILVIMAKGFKFLLTKASRRHSGRLPKVSDLIKFYAKPPNEDAGDIDGIVDSYLVFDPLPPLFRSDLQTNKQGKEVVMISSELTFDRHSQTKGINVFYNQWLGPVFDVNGVIESPISGQPYQCSVMRIRKYADEPHGIWFIVYVQYLPKTLLNGPFTGFFFNFPNSNRKAIWCREVLELKEVSKDQVFAFGSENVGSWVHFYIDEAEKVWRLEKIEKEGLETKITEDEKFMSTIRCEFRGEMRNGHPLWYSDMVQEVLDPHNISHPKEGDRRVFWCVLECRGKGNEVWEIESKVMERRQRVEGNERVQRNERGYSGVENKERAWRIERVGGYKRMDGNERVQRGEMMQRNERVDEAHQVDTVNGAMGRMSVGIYSPPLTPAALSYVHSLPSEANNGVEEEPTLSSICKKLFGYSEVRRVTRDANPLLYAQLMERLNGYGSG